MVPIREPTVYASRILPREAGIHLAITSTATPAIFATSCVRSVGPNNLISPVLLAINPKNSPSNRCCPGITGRKTNRETVEYTVAKCSAITTGNEDSHMLYFGQQLETLINRIAIS